MLILNNLIDLRPALATMSVKSASSAAGAGALVGASGACLFLTLQNLGRGRSVYAAALGALAGGFGYAFGLLSVGLSAPQVLGIVSLTSLIGYLSGVLTSRRFPQTRPISFEVITWEKEGEPASISRYYPIGSTAVSE